MGGRGDRGSGHDRGDGLQGWQVGAGHDRVMGCRGDRGGGGDRGDGARVQR